MHATPHAEEGLKRFAAAVGGTLLQHFLETVGSRWQLWPLDVALAEFLQTYGGRLFWFAVAAKYARAAGVEAASVDVAPSGGPVGPDAIETDVGVDVALGANSIAPTYLSLEAACEGMVRNMCTEDVLWCLPANSLHEFYTARLTFTKQLPE